MVMHAQKLACRVSMLARLAWVACPAGRPGWLARLAGLVGCPGRLARLSGPPGWPGCVRPAGPAGWLGPAGCPGWLVWPAGPLPSRRREKGTGKGLNWILASVKGSGGDCFPETVCSRLRPNCSGRPLLQDRAPPIQLRLRLKNIMVTGGFFYRVGFINADPIGVSLLVPGISFFLETVWSRLRPDCSGRPLLHDRAPPIQLRLQVKHITETCGMQLCVGLNNANPIGGKTG